MYVCVCVPKFDRKSIVEFVARLVWRIRSLQAAGAVHHNQFGLRL